MDVRARTTSATARNAPKRRRATTVVLLALGLALAVSCACPPLVVDYATPEATLATWQAQLCRDDLRGEFRCLSEGLQRRMGGWSTYVAVRRQLLEDNELLVWFLGRTDLAEALQPSLGEQGDGRATRVLARGDEQCTVHFVLEPAVLIELVDGSELFGVPHAPRGGPLLLGQALSQVADRQWIELPQPLLSPGQLADVRSVHIEDRWKIDDLEGLLLTTEPTP